jgi:protein-L-isoaspartate O-methyltransferase
VGPLFDQLGLATGDRVLHVGAGLGYYSAILAEIVGRGGEVTAIEIDAGLAEGARANLARAWPQASVVAGDGFGLRADEPVDAIVVNAGVSHLALPRLDSLKADGGRLLIPFTNANLWGAFLMISRQGARYPVRFASRVGIIACAGGRDAEAEARLTAALARADYTAVKSLRRSPEEPDDTCWLAGEGWWLSTATAGGDQMARRRSCRRTAAAFRALWRERPGVAVAGNDRVWLHLTLDISIQPVAQLHIVWRTLMFVTRGRHALDSIGKTAAFFDDLVDPLLFLLEKKRAALVVALHRVLGNRT